MLNAFQHQRSFHIYPPPQSAVAALCSTLFSIKDHFTSGKARYCFTLISAQRFSASKIISQGSSDRSSLSLPGAQRFSASKIISHSCTPAFDFNNLVLNAFQHQRSFHHFRATISPRRKPCSTLFSIKDHFTQEISSVRHIAGQVLNAFQHQRSFHPPYGARAFTYGGAQRFSASKIISLPGSMLLA